MRGCFFTAHFSIATLSKVDYQSFPRSKKRKGSGNNRFLSSFGRSALRFKSSQSIMNTGFAVCEVFLKIVSFDIYVMRETRCGEG